MKLSVSTKIFLGFAVVIVAFGAACAYTIVRMGALRESVQVVWQEVVPATAQLRSLARRLRAPEEFLALRRPTDAQWLQRLLPALEPFSQLEQIEEQLDKLTGSGSLADRDRRAVSGVVTKLREFRTGPDLASALVGEGLGELQVDRQVSSADVFDRLVRRTVKRANEGQLRDSSPETRAMVRALRRISRVTRESLRELAVPIRDLNARAADDEKAATLAVILIASGALVLSLIMLIIAQLTLRPIRDLREGARRIAAGHYDESVDVRSGDEIGQLAEEFNTMAQALREREAELARQREELVRAERLATIGKLAAQITHEVRNPLLSIGLNAEMLEEELEEQGLEDDDGLLGAIQTEVQRLKAITEEYLRYARLPRPDLGEVDLGALVQQFLSFITHEIEGAGVELRTEGVAPAGQGGPPLIRADADQLRQALLNVARNAIEAMRDEPSPRVLAFDLAPQGDGGVEIAISDTGPGISAELRERIFEPFVTSKEGGTGIGLAMTQQIVAEHGGSIAVETPVEGGRGTRFSIRLPPRGGCATVVESGDEGY